MNKFGKCSDCNVDLEPVYFIEKENKLFENTWVSTGRVREATDYLLCPCCGMKVMVDDSFDGPWHVNFGNRGI